MSRTVGILIVYGALVVVLVVCAVLFVWRRYRRPPPLRHCAFCRERPYWLYRGYWICNDQRCLDQAEAEADYRMENR
jgi:hypothetical protein